jgi:hypothetical protein
MKRAFLYARVSTVDKEQNPEVQFSEIREFCRRRDWTLTESGLPKWDRSEALASLAPQFEPADSRQPDHRGRGNLAGSEGCLLV